jgi:hypothetical protein
MLRPLLLLLLGGLCALLWLLLLRLCMLRPLLRSLGRLCALLWLLLLRLRMLRLLLRPLGRLCALLRLRLLLWLLACLRLLWLRLRALLLGGLPTLSCFRLALSFLLPVLPRVRRVDRREKQKQGCRAGCSNELHGNYLL